MNNGKLALVTGGAGFIGSHLVHALLSAGNRVRVLDNLSGPKSWRRLQDVIHQIEPIEADLRDQSAVERAVVGVDVIFHKAALVSVPESVAHAEEYHAVDATGTLTVLEAARKCGVKRVIYASTSAIYGDAPEQPKVESMRGLPTSPYGIAKYTGELYMSAYAALHQMQTISLRYFNVFGPGQDPKSQYGAAIPSIISKILAGDRPIIYGDGEQTRDFCHVANVVRANLLAAHASHLSGQVVNIGCGKRVSVNEVVRLASRLLGKAIEPQFAPTRSGDVRDSLADISAARQALGYEPVMQFEDGLHESIAWYRDQFNSVV